MAAEFTGVVAHSLRHLRVHVTRESVHLADASDPWPGPDDIRCMLEARSEARIEAPQSAASTLVADTIPAAVQGAAGNLASMIEKILGRTEGQQRAKRV
ncbi:MAG: hypothetical protein ABIT38_10310 [Gemmatimonadaceae bacterium]